MDNADRDPSAPKIPEPPHLVCPKCREIWLPAWHWATRHKNNAISLRRWIPEWEFGCDGCKGYVKLIIHPTDPTVGMVVYKGIFVDRKGNSWYFVGQPGRSFGYTKLCHYHLWNAAWSGAGILHKQYRAAVLAGYTSEELGDLIDRIEGRVVDDGQR